MTNAVGSLEHNVRGWELERKSGLELVYAVLTAAAFSAAAVSLVELPWAHRNVALLGAVALLVPAVVVSFVVGVLCRLSARWWRGRRDAFWLCILVGGGAIALVGAYLSNVLLVDPPTSGKTLHGYAITLLCAAATMFGIARMLRGPRGEAFLRRVNVRRVVAVSALGLGIVCAIADAVVHPHLYFSLHLAAATISLAGFSIVIHVQRPGTLRPRGVLLAVAALWAVVSLVGGRFGHATSEIVRHATVHRRAWTLAHRVWSGGRSLRLPPPSCDGVETEGAAAASREAGRPDPPVAPADAGPRILVLVTIDSFRCGFGRHDRDELRDVCPELTRLLASSSSYRFDAHANSPATLPSTDAMQRVDGERLGDRLRAAGIASTVIATHRHILEGRGVRASFDHVDDTLAPRAEDGTATTSDETTDRALAALRAMVADGRRHFLWVHYYDPHAPYIEVPDSPWKFLDLPAYVAEMRRTDAAVARLVETVQRDLSASAVLVLTADHGEAFGEHGATFHGVNLYEEMTRVPLIVWANDEEQRRALPADLPVGSTEVGPYLFAVATRQPFVSAAQTRLFVSTPEDEQQGLVDDRGFKLIEHRSLGYTELFDLRSDPTEQHDLTRERPDVLLEMRCRLARAE